MNLKSHNISSGFMLEEVMIALVITSLVIMPVLDFVSTYMVTSTRYKDKSVRLIFSKNFMLQQAYFSQEDKTKSKSLNEKTKDPILDLKYVRSQVKKIHPFQNFKDPELQNLFMQQVEVVSGKNKDNIVCFLYKP